jgi:hypothetical protein
MDIAATETIEERIYLVVILGSGVLVAPKPGPQARSVVTGTRGASLSRWAAIS